MRFISQLVRRSGWSALALSAIVLQVVYFHTVAGTGMSTGLALALALPAFLLLTTVLGPAIDWLGRRAAGSSRRNLALLAAGFAVFGWLLTWAAAIPPAPVQPIDLQVEATGGKSAAARSSEVWVRLQRDGISIPPGEVQHDGNWQTSGEFLVSVPGKQPARLHWKGEPTGQVRLIMVSHPWSGKARVRVGGRVRDLDLYSAGSDAKIIALAGGEVTDDRLDYPDRTPLQSWVQVLDGLLIGAALYGVFLALGTRSLAAPDAAEERWSLARETAVHALPTLVVGAVLLALFFPGLMTSDSLDQWRQAGSGHYNDAHPLLYALAIRAMRHFWDSPAIVAAAQCIAMAFSAGWLIALVRRALRAGFGAAWAGAWLVALHPMIALTNITLWKDVFYTVAVVALTAFTIGVVFLARPRIGRPLPALGLVAAAVACMSLRHNGPPVALAALLIMFVMRREVRRAVALATVISISGFLLLKGPVASQLGAQRTNLSYALYAHHIAAHLKQNEVIQRRDREWLATLRPIEEWEYVCSLANPTINKDFNAGVASRSSGRLLRMWIDLAVDHPMTELAHVACVSGLVWRTGSGPVPPLYLYKTGLSEKSGQLHWTLGDEPELREESVSPEASQRLGSSILDANVELFWRPATFLYLLIFSAAVASFRCQSQRWLLAAATCVTHSAVLAAASVAQDARYQLPVYVVALAIAPLLLFGRRARPQPGPHRHEAGVGLLHAVESLPGPGPLGSTVAVVIPCYRVTAHIQGVIAAVGPEVGRIYCVDDACPDGSGDYITGHVVDPRVRVLRHDRNQGVGGAVMTGYRQAIADGADIIVKIDGDGQMDPALLPDFVMPIITGEADYTKGNRFWNLKEISRMPVVRRVGNLGLSFFAKASTGYWDLFDPTNGYTAIHASVAARLPVESISRRYFFETDMLFRLNAMRAVVVDVPMDARYGEEVSNLRVSRVLGEFLAKHLVNLGKRIGYSYFLRDLSIGSLELVAAVGLLGFGATFGGWHWWLAAGTGKSAPLGTVMIATVAIVSGLQFLLAFLNYDIASVPRRPLHRVLSRPRRALAVGGAP